MSFVKNLLKMIILLALLFGLVYLYHYLTDVKVRQDLKKQCQGETCPCFYNIVDFRLTKDQAAIFFHYLENRRVRPETKILEFTDLETAFEISQLFNVCQPEQLLETSKVEEESKEDSEAFVNEEVAVEQIESEEKIEKGEEDV